MRYVAPATGKLKQEPDSLGESNDGWRSFGGAGNWASSVSTAQRSDSNGKVGVSKHSAAFRRYKTEQLLTLSPASTGVNGLVGQIHLLFPHVQAKYNLCSETPSCSILAENVASSSTSDDSWA